jgi:hypothetical protein
VTFQGYLTGLKWASQITSVSQRLFHHDSGRVRPRCFHEIGGIERAPREGIGMLGVDKDSGPSNLLYHHRSADVSAELRVHVHDLFGAVLDDTSDGTCTALFPRRSVAVF